MDRSASVAVLSCIANCLAQTTQTHKRAFHMYCLGWPNGASFLRLYAAGLRLLCYRWDMLYMLYIFVAIAESECMLVYETGLLYKIDARCYACLCIIQIIMFHLGVWFKFLNAKCYRYHDPIAYTRLLGMMMWLWYNRVWPRTRPMIKERGQWRSQGGDVNGV